MQAVQDGVLARAVWGAEAALALMSCPAHLAPSLLLQEGVSPSAAS